MFIRTLKVADGALFRRGLFFFFTILAKRSGEANPQLLMHILLLRLYQSCGFKINKHLIVIIVIVYSPSNREPRNLNWNAMKSLVIFIIGKFHVTY